MKEPLAPVVAEEFVCVTKSANGAEHQFRIHGRQTIKRGPRATPGGDCEALRGPTLSDSPYLEQPPREVVGELRVRTALLGAVTVHTFERGNSRRDPQRGGLCRIGG